MTMIERVARALFKEEWDSKSSEPWENAYDDEREAWLKSARAAIGAMREPTPEILKVIEFDLPADGFNVEYLRDEAPGYWRAMIDAALSEDGK